MSHFDLKIWNTGGTKIWPKFLGQNDSFFSVIALREKKWVILTYKIELLTEKILTQIFRSKWLNFYLRAPRAKIESFCHWRNYNWLTFITGFI